MAKSRTEIDKDMMYRKIMPSTSRSTGGNNTPNNQSPDYAISSNGIEGHSVPNGHASVSTNASSETIPAPLSPGIQSPFAAPLRRNSAVVLQIPESQDMVLVNLMEALVLSRLDATLMRFNCCKCNKCKKDIAAIALNKLTPKYVVICHEDESKKKQAEEQYGTEVTSALVQAIMLVKKEPRH